MKKIILFIVVSFFASFLFAQQPAKVEPPKPGATVAVAPIVPTKELKRLLAKNLKKKNFKAALPIADTLVKRNPKSEDLFFKKVTCEVMLKMDKQAIADIKKRYKNKDTAGSILALLPYSLDLKYLKRSGDIYYKSAMAWAPKNGVTYMMYAFELADNNKAVEALDYAQKGYALLVPTNKKLYAYTYGKLLHMADKKEEAYKFLENEIAAGNTSTDVIREYFGFYKSDNKYQEGIDKATELINKEAASTAKEPVITYYSKRGMLYDAMGNSEKACEDAVTLKDKYEEGDFWLMKFNCQQVMADVTPTMQRTYIYEVVFNEKTYDFRVTNPKVDMDNGVSFKYKLTGDVGYNGTVNISKEAIATAHDQMNKFGKDTYELTDRTTVWISKEVFNELKTTGSSIINANDWAGSREFTVVTNEYDINDDFFTVKVDDQDKYIRCIKVEAKDGEQLWIKDDPNNPIILKMKVDFSIELKQVL
jgi:hypothetical protein